MASLRNKVVLPLDCKLAGLWVFRLLLLPIWIQLALLMYMLPKTHTHVHNTVLVMEMAFLLADEPVECHRGHGPSFIHTCIE